MEQQDNSGEVSITASYEEYQIFIVSLVWHDLYTELLVQKSMIEDALAVADEPKDIYRLQGQLMACNDFITMPSDFMRLMEEHDTEQPPVDDLSSSEDTADSDGYYNQLLDKYQGE